MVQIRTNPIYQKEEVWGKTQSDCSRTMKYWTGINDNYGWYFYIKFAMFLAILVNFLKFRILSPQIHSPLLNFSNKPRCLSFSSYGQHSGYESPQIIISFMKLFKIRSPSKAASKLRPVSFLSDCTWTCPAKVAYLLVHWSAKSRSFLTSVAV